jgi:hypothetical protein
MNTQLFRPLLGALIGMIGCSISNAGMIVSDFNDGTMQGWTKRQPFGGTLVNPVSGGNGGGYLLATDNQPGGGNLFAVAPSKFLGDLTEFQGISWDEFVFVRGAGGSRTVRSTRLLISGGPTGTSYAIVEDALGPIGQWRSRSVDFLESNFQRTTKFGSGSDAFENVLRDVKLLAFELDTSTLANGGPESGIDNVTLVATPVPEPSTGWAFLAGAIGTTFLLKRRRERPE